jgi:hypothetical protein
MLRGLLAMMAAMSVSCSSSTPTPAGADLKVGATPAAGGSERSYLLERVDEAAVVQLYADGFDALPVDQRLLIWHLYRAAIAGRDIFYDQRYAHNLDMRDVLEAIITHPSDDAGTQAEILRYTKLFWINSVVQPTLEPVRDSDGTVRDVKVTYPRDLAKQMLEYSDATRASREAFRASTFRQAQGR